MILYLGTQLVQNVLLSLCLYQCITPNLNSTLVLSFLSRPLLLCLGLSTPLSLISFSPSAHTYTRGRTCHSCPRQNCRR